MPFGEPIVNPAVRDFRFKVGDVPQGPLDHDPSILQAIKSAFSLYHPVGSAYESQKHRAIPYQDERVDENYRAFSDETLEPTISHFPREFEEARNQAHAHRIKAKLDRQMQNMQIIRDSGMLGVGMSFIAVAADPLNYVGGVGLFSKAKTANKVRKLIQLANNADEVARVAASFGTKFTEIERLALANRDLTSITLKDYGGFSKMRVKLDVVRRRAAYRASQEVRGELEGALAASGAAQGVSRVRAFAETGAAVAIPAMASEGVLAATRESYEAEEFVYATAAAGLLGGAIGAWKGAIPRVSQTELDSLVARISDEIQHGPIQGRIPDEALLTGEQIAAMGPAKVEAHILDQMKLASPGTFDLVGENKILRATLRDSPTGRLMTDTGEGSDEIRALVATLQDHPALRRGAIAPSISAKIDAQLAKASVDADNVEYLRRTSRMDELEFDRRLVLAMTGEADESAEVNKAAKAGRRVFDDALRRSIAAGLLKEGLENHFPRFYLWDAIQADQEGFVKAIMPWVKSEKKAWKIAKKMASIKDHAFLDPANFNMMSKSGVFLPRILNDVPTKALLPYIDTDVPNVIRRYGRMANAQIEYAKLTPGDPLDGLNLTSASKRVEEIFKNRIENAKTQKAKDRLVEEMKARVSDLEYIRKIHLGDFDLDQFDSGMHKVMRGLRGVATMVYLPWAGVASVQDTLAVAWHNSARGFWRGSSSWLKRQIVTRLENGEIDNRDLQRMARASEYALSDMSRASLLQDFSGTTMTAGVGRRKETRLGRLQRASSAYLTWNGMRPANVMARQVAINAGADDLLHMIQRRLDGAVTKNDAVLMAQAGIGDELAGRIAKEMKAGHYLDDRGFFSPDLTKWDPDTADDFAAALFQNAKLSYVNPTAPILPKWAKNEAGAMLFQFLSFPWASKNNYLINGYQRLMLGQIGRLTHGALMVSGFGIAYAYLRAAADGEDLDRVEFDEMVERGIGRTGILSMIEIANEYLYAATGGEAGWQEFLGRKISVEGASVPAFDALVSLRTDAENVVNFFTGERFSDSEKQKLGNRIPWVNVPWISETAKAMIEVME